MFKSETSHVQDSKICSKSKGFKLETCCYVGYYYVVSAVFLRCFTCSQKNVVVLVSVLLLLLLWCSQKIVTCCCVGCLRVLLLKLVVAVFVTCTYKKNWYFFIWPKISSPLPSVLLLALLIRHLACCSHVNNPIHLHSPCIPNQFHQLIHCFLNLALWINVEVNQQNQLFFHI